MYLSAQPPKICYYTFKEHIVNRIDRRLDNMTRFKKELIKRGVQTEETLPFIPFEHIEAIIVHSDTSIVSTYDNRVGWCFVEYGRNLKPIYQWGEDDIHEDGWINKTYIAEEV